MKPEEGTGLLNVPSEILNIILGFLDVDDVLNMRQVCVDLCKPTYDRTLWMEMLRHMGEDTPLPLEIRRVLNASAGGTPRDPASTDIEQVVKSARRIANKWSRPRSRVSRLRKPSESSGSLLGLEVVADRWILVIYGDGYILVYDTQDESSSEPVIRAYFSPAMPTNWTSYSIAAEEDKTLVVTVVVAYTLTRIFEVNLVALSESNIRVDQAISSDPSTLISSTRAVCSILLPDRRVAISRTPSVIEIVDLEERLPDGGFRRATIRVHSEDLEDAWNGVIAVEFLGAHVLVFKAKSLEIHEYESLLLDGADRPHHGPLKQTFITGFRDVSLSACSVSSNGSTQTRIHEIFAFANDFIQGLYQYVIRLAVPFSSDLPPSLDVQLLEVYPLASTSLDNRSLSPPVHARYTPPNHSTLHPPVTHLHELDDSPTPTYTHVHHLTSLFHGAGTSSPPAQVHRAPFTHGHPSSVSARGFVSAHRIGPGGKRAVWIERQRSSTSREVLVWNYERHRRGLCEEDSFSVEPLPIAVEIPKKVVFTLSSYDLRDDINFCAFSEVYGTIVLGHRSGDISVLGM